MGELLEMRNYGKRILEERRKKKWSQETLALKSGIKRSTVSRLENDKPVRRSTLKKVADALGIKVNELEAPRVIKDYDDPQAKYLHELLQAVIEKTDTDLNLVENLLRTFLKAGAA